MTTDFSLMDIMGNFTGMPVAPDEVSTATTQVSMGAGAGRGFINPKYALNANPVVPQEPAGAASVAPVSPDYNTSIAQQESGGRADIGFHDKTKSTAYGPYGTTAAGWQDARKLNPELPADITQATPEQLTAGQDAYTQQNAGYLKNYGVPVNENTLSAAHFLGAKGLSDFLKTGYISPQAAAANGGEENVRKIVNARLGGQAAPASGAAQQPAPEAAPVSPEQAAQQPTEQAYTGQGLKTPGGQTQAQLEQQKQYSTVLNSNSQEGIAKLAFDPATPPDVQRAALDKLHGTMAVQQGMEKAQRVVESLGANPTPQSLNKAMSDKDTGSYFKVLLFQALGWTGKAKQELDKIMPDYKYQGVTVDGENYLAKVNASNGLIETAWKGGQPVDESTLAAVREQGSLAQGKYKPDVSGTEVEKGGMVGRIVTQTLSNGTTRTYVESGGKQYALDASWKPRTISTAAAKADIQLVSDLKKKHGTNVLDAEKEYVALNGPFKTPEDRQAFRQAYGFEAGMPGGAATTTAPITGAVPAPVSTVPAGAVAPTSLAATGQIPPANINKPLAEQANVPKIGLKEQEAFVKFKDEDIQPKAQAGQQIGRIRREQLQGPDGILNNPELAGIMQGQGSAFSEARNILRDMVSGNFKDGDELSRRVAALDLNQRQKDVLYRQIGLNAQINPLTLKANAGPGAISEAEHKINAQANVDITRLPLYSGLSLMTRDQYEKDIAQARADFGARHPELKTTEAFNRAWAAERSRIDKTYDNIYRARADYVSKYSKNGNNPGAVVDAFKHYPVPEWNAEKSTWEYKNYSAKAARPKLEDFVR